MLEKPLKKHLIVILTLTIGVYCISLFNDFVYDDTVTVTGNLFVRDWSNFPELFSKTYFSRSGEETYRPIVTLTYFVDYALWRLKPSGYHLTNILIHLANVVLLYLFLLSLSLDKGVAFLGALLFGVHPVQAETVNAISFREDLLVVFFLLPALLFFLRISNPSGMGKVKRLALYLLSLGLYLLALLSKEMAIVFPLFLIGYRLCFVGIKREQKRDIFIYLFSGYVVVTLGYLFLYFGPFSNPNPRTFSYPEVFIRLLTLPRVLVHYLWLTLVPWELNADYVIEFSRSWYEFSVLFSMFILIGFGVVVFRLVKRYREEMFGLWWFFVGLLPVMNIVPIYNIMAERYLYLPFVGLSLFFSTWLIYLYRWRVSRYSYQLWRKAVATTVVLVVIVLVLRTVSRNMDWKDNFSLWSKTVIISPESVRAHNNLGIAYTKKDLWDRAIAEYKEAIRIDPDVADAHNNLGLAYAKKGLWDQAIAAYRKALEVNPDVVEPHNNLGNAYAKKGLWDQAIAEYKEALRINPDLAETHNNLGFAYAEKGLLDQAIAEYREAIRVNRDFAKAHNNLGLAYAKKGLSDQAIAEYREAIKINPDLVDTHLNLGNIYAVKGLINLAIAEYREAINIKPDFAKAHNNLGVIYAEKGLLDQAIAEYREALRINPDLVDAHFNLGVEYAEKGLLDEAIAEYREALRIRPDLVNGHYNIGVIYAERGLLDLAIVEFREALRINPDFKQAKENLKRAMHLRESQ